MAIRKFIKMYNIRKDDVDDKGNVNPDAALYPMYMTQYRDNKTGKPFSELPPEAIDDKLSDEDKPYDNSSNAHPKRTVHIHEAGNDDSTHIVGPDLKRGYSALAFANKDKRHGDDYFSDWHKINREKDIHSILHTDASKIMDNKQYGMNYSDTGSDIRSIADTISPGSQYKGFYTVPLIIEADDNDVINYNDVIKDNYDPTRDYLPEVQLKRIIRRSIMPNAFTNNAKMAVTSKFASFAQDVYNVSLMLDSYAMTLHNAATSAQDANALYNKLLEAFERSIKHCTTIIDSGYDVSDTLEDLAATDDTVDTALADIGYTLDNVEERMSDLKTLYDKFIQDTKIHVTPGMSLTRDLSLLKETAKVVVPVFENLYIHFNDLDKQCADLYNYLSEMSDVGFTGKYAPDIDSVQKATQKGGAFDWYDSTTYSDERLKNIYNGCHDVTLSDKQLKYIYDDFRKFKKGATQSNITKGLRGLGQ